MLLQGGRPARHAAAQCDNMLEDAAVGPTPREALPEGLNRAVGAVRIVINRWGRATTRSSPLILLRLIRRSSSSGNVVALVVEVPLRLRRG